MQLPIRSTPVSVLSRRATLLAFFQHFNYRLQLLDSCGRFR